MIRVQQYGLLPPVEGADVVRAQLRAGHDYGNVLTSIERGRRHAIRKLHETPEVTAAMDLVRAATRSDRKDRLQELEKARRRAESETRCEGGHWAVPFEDIERYPYSPLYELERIALLDASIRRDARALTTAYWGTYLTIEDAADKSRKAPLYDYGGLEPASPRFVPWDGRGQIGVQLQGGLPTEGALAGSDTRVRWVKAPDRPVPHKTFYDLWIRVGSDGRKPIWAVFPIPQYGRTRGPNQKSRTRVLPDAGMWKWVRVSCRREGPREHWSVEITLDAPDSRKWRTQDDQLSGAVALELLWAQQDEEMLVGRWLDSNGRRGDLKLLAYDVAGIKKPSDIRSVRDTLLNDLRPRLAQMLSSMAKELPGWLRRETATMLLWKSPGRFHALADRWRREKYDGARVSYDMLDAWEERDNHLYAYEAGGRGKALRRRQDHYRLIADQWGRQYRDVLIRDVDLSREARWGDDSDRRFIVSPQELRGALRNVFGDHAYDVLLPEGEEEADWHENTIERWRQGEILEGTRAKKRRSKINAQGGNAWEKRKKKKVEREEERRRARNEEGKAAE